MANTALFVAAILTIGIGAVHSWLGERRLIGPLLSPQRRQGILASSTFARQVLRFAWHLTTLAWWGMGAMLVALVSSPLDGQDRTVLLIIGLTFLLTGTVILIVSRGRHLAWPVFLMIAGLSVVPLLQSSP
ncbi:MAG: hypothetical protein OEU09_09660 [Rhodospirillales bacterium]|nr:hypothetical protein [Rhodospirillales bacterium]MDH3911553.1 hypothetical protein [Rhodospirillales bacterium]MDH3918069.1 hypothetical protein [Rhodospirillales bacterium]MDH3967035.1 hypothetical protein [Rhodospirillales bacterium]